MSTARRALRRNAAATTVTAVASTVLVVLSLAYREMPAAIFEWAAPPVAILAVVLGSLWIDLDANRNRRGSLYPALGAPNLVTVARGVLVAWLAGFLLLPWGGALAWVPALLYGAVAALDAVDGAVARRADRTTSLGASLDVRVDALGVLIAALVGVRAGVVPAWYLSVGLARYAFVLASWVRRRRGRPLFPLPTRPSRRVLAGAQMAYLPVALAPVSGARVSAAAALVAGVPLLLGFVRDWLYVSGRLRD